MTKNKFRIHMWIEEFLNLGDFLQTLVIEEDAFIPTVDGRNPANLLRLVVYPIIYRVLPRWLAGFLNHQH